MQDFNNVLFRNEFSSLAGRSYRTILSLSAILFSTVFVLGLSSGSIADLRKRMSNPYTNWINLPVELGVHEGEIRRYFDDSLHLKNFNIRSLGEYNVFRQTFITADHRDMLYLKGTSVSPNESILRSVLYEIPDNLIVEHQTFDAQPCGFIVTEKFLELLGYSAPYRTVRNVMLKVDHYNLIVDINAIVKELPSLYTFFCTPVMSNMLSEDFDKTGFLNIHDNNTFPLLIRAEKDEDSEDILFAYFSQYGPARVTPQQTLQLGQGAEYHQMNVVFPWDAYPSHRTLMDFIDSDTAQIHAILHYKEFYCNTDGFDKIGTAQYLAFHFNTLDQIREFREFMFSQFRVEVTMQQIESAENFSLVSTLTRLISLVLFGFALLSIGFYIFSVIRSHLQKLIPSLGTLKAFGIRNDNLTLTYIKIVSAFCGLAICLAYAFCLPVQFFLANRQTRLQLDILNWNVVLALLVISLACILITARTTRSIICHTPGDLVYNRI